MKWKQVGEAWDSAREGVGHAWDHASESIGKMANAVSRHEQRAEIRRAVEQGLDRRLAGNLRPARGSQHPLRSLAAAGLGAGLMYLLDPQLGRRRRALVRDQLVHALHEIDGAVGVVSRDMRNRSRGAVSRVRSLPGRLIGESVSDAVLLARVRSRLGRDVSRPRAVEVDVSDGRVCLKGSVLAAEVESLLAAIAGVPGVREVQDRMDAHPRPGSVQAQSGRRQRGGELCQANWSPTARLAVGATGTALMAAGTGTRGLAGLLFTGMGAGLLCRALTNVPVRDWAEAAERASHSRIAPAHASDGASVVSATHAMPPADVAGSYI